MLTFTQMKKQTAKICGIHYQEPEMAMIASNIHNATRLFQNNSGRYWVRREKRTDLIAQQQYYQVASDMFRVITVKARNGNVIVPLKEVASEDEWNRLNAFEWSGSYPSHYFVRGMDEIGIYPKPSMDVEDGLMVAYEPRMPDMSREDTDILVDVIQNDVNVVKSTTDTSSLLFDDTLLNECWIQVTGSGGAGNWYKIAKVLSQTALQVDNNYLGLSENGTSAVIGQTPMFPEEYHEACVFYAAFKFFSMRKDTDSSAMYRTLFQDHMDSYQAVYGKKTKSGVINKRRQRMPNITDVFKTSMLKG